MHFFLYSFWVIATVRFKVQMSMCVTSELSKLLLLYTDFHAIFSNASGISHLHMQGVSSLPCLLTLCCLQPPRAADTWVMFSHSWWQTTSGSQCSVFFSILHFLLHNWGDAQQGVNCIGALALKDWMRCFFGCGSREGCSIAVSIGCS